MGISSGTYRYVCYSTLQHTATLQHIAYDTVTHACVDVAPPVHRYTSGQHE